MENTETATLAHLRERLPYLHFAEILEKEIGKASVRTVIDLEYTFTTISIWDENQVLLSVRHSPRFKMLEVYSADKTQTNRWETYTKKHLPRLLEQKNLPAHSWEACQELVFQKRLALADAVGKEGACSGNFENAYYNKIQLSKEGVFLEQIDWHNATLLGAKSYNMRKLFMFVPFKEQASYEVDFQKKADALDILRKDGVLLFFSDYSTNKDCGNRLKEAFTQAGFQ